MSMRRNSRWWLALVVALAGLAFMGGRASTESSLLGDVEGSDQATPGTTGAASGADDAPSSKPAVQSLPDRAATAPQTVEPLPPVDQPLAESFDDLLERAKRGDARAACRLSVDLARCHRRAQMAGWSSSYERQAARARDDAAANRMIDQVVMLDAAVQRDEAFCAGLGHAQLEWSFPVQLSAARWNPDLRVWVASQPSLDIQRFLGDLEGWQQYRAVALPWLRDAALAGDPVAQVLMARIHGDDRRNGPPIPPFREIDDAAFVTWAHVLNRRGIVYQAVERASAEAQARLGPLASAAALAEGDRILATSPSDFVDESVGNDVTRRSFSPAPSAESCED